MRLFSFFLLVTFFSSVAVAAPLDRVTDVGSGSRHSCAALDDGSVMCWGANDFAQLGDGSTKSSVYPVLVRGVSNATQVVSAEYFSCALLNDGTVDCWGGVAPGNLPQPPLPLRKMSGLTNITQISAGKSHACALRSNGSVACWGSAAEGQVYVRTFLVVGFPHALDDPSVPQTAIDVSNAVEIISGGNSSCARLVGGDYKCWGRSVFADFASTQPQSTPVEIPGQRGVTKLALGLGHACGVFADQSLKCWGVGDSGQLGNGVVNFSSTPITVPGVTSPSSVAVLGNTTCAASANGAVRCWGWGQRGAVGNDSAVTVSAPTPVSSALSFRKLSASDSHICGNTTSGTVACWGEGSSGQLGNGLPRVHLVPFKPTDVANVKEFVVGAFSSCAVEIDSTVSCMGAIPLPNDGVMGNKPVRVPGISNAQSVGIGWGYACALTQAGSVFCWGSDNYDALGGSRIYWSGSPLPPSAAITPSASHLSVGDYHSCIVALTQRVWCWGNNYGGQLGPLGNSRLPVEIPGIDDAVRVSAGFDYSCALRSNGTVRCWGNYRSGFRDLPGISTAVNLHADNSVVCARLSDGALKCFYWDVDENDNLVALPLSSRPDLPIALSPSAASTAWDFTGNSLCQVKPIGEIECVGFGNYGLLGNGGLANVVTPVRVKNVTQAKSVSGSNYARCAVETSGQVWCWGDPKGASLGSSASDFQQRPVLVELPSASTTTTVTTNPTTSETWESYSVKARVTKSNGAPATGALQISDDNGAICKTGALDAVGEASCLLASTKRGLRNITADYVADSIDIAQSRGAVSHNVVTTCDLDVDGDGVVRAQTDGVMLVRGLLGLPDAAIVNQVINVNGTRTDPAAVGNHIRKMVANGALSPNGNSFTQPSDQLALLRVLSGFSGEGASIYPELRSAAQHFATVCNFSR
jgi:alpha-tubulin suppressor-like RCC1 family protein